MNQITAFINDRRNIFQNVQIINKYKPNISKRHKTVLNKDSN